MAMSSRFSQSNEGIFAPKWLGTISPQSARSSQSKKRARNRDSVIFFFDVVFVPLGDFDDDISGAVGNGLAAEARFRGDARGFVKLVELGVGRFVAGFESLFDDDMACRARADAAAGVIEAGFDAFGNIENAAGKSVVAVRNLCRIDFDRFAAGKKCNFVFLRGGSVFNFFDVWVAAAHGALSFRKSKNDARRR